MTSVLCRATENTATLHTVDLSLAAETVLIGSVLPEFWSAVDALKPPGISKNSLITVLQNILRDVPHFRVRNPRQRTDVMSDRGDARLFADVMTQYLPIPRVRRFWTDFVSNHLLIYKEILEYVAALVRSKSSTAAAAVRQTDSRAKTPASVKRKLGKAPAHPNLSTGAGGALESSCTHSDTATHAPANETATFPTERVTDGYQPDMDGCDRNYTTPTSRHAPVTLNDRVTTTNERSSGKSGKSTQLDFDPRSFMSDESFFFVGEGGSAAPSAGSGGGESGGALKHRSFKKVAENHSFDASPLRRDALDMDGGALKNQIIELTILPKIPLTSSEILQEQTYLMSYNLERLGASQLFGFFNTDEDVLPESYSPPFDRNDLFVTNVRDAHVLFKLAENVCRDSIARVKSGLTSVNMDTFPSIYVVLIRFNGDPQQRVGGLTANAPASASKQVDLSRKSLYITWCVKQDYASFLENVLRGIIPCNQHFTNLIEGCSRVLGGNYSQWKRMFTIELIDDSGGTITEKSLPVFLASLNGYIDQYNEPAAVNINSLRAIPNGRHRLIFESGSLQAYRFNWMYVKAYSGFIEKIKDINAAQSTCQDIVRTFFSKYHSHLEQHAIAAPVLVLACSGSGIGTNGAGVNAPSTHADTDVVTEATVEDRDPDLDTDQISVAVADVDADAGHLAGHIAPNICLVHQTSDARAAHEINGLWNLFQQYFASVHDHLTKIGVEFQLLKTVACQRREYVQQAFAAAQVMQFRSDVPIPNTLLNLYDESIEDVEFKTTSVMYTELSEGFKQLIDMKERMLHFWVRPAAKISTPVEMYRLLRSLCTLNLWRPTKLCTVGHLAVAKDDTSGASSTFRRGSAPTASTASRETVAVGRHQRPEGAAPAGITCSIPLVTSSVSTVMLGETSRIRSAACALRDEVVNLPSPPKQIAHEVINKAFRLTQKRVHPDKRTSNEKEHATQQSTVVSDAKSFVSSFY